MSAVVFDHTEFLQLAQLNTNDWANQLVSRIGGISGNEVPQTWALNITQQDSPALHKGISEVKHVYVSDLYRDPRNRDERLACITLLIKRGDIEYLLPDDDFRLQQEDRLLLCGRFGASIQMEWISKNHNVFDYLITGTERASGSVWRWLERKSPIKSR